MYRVIAGIYPVCLFIACSISEYDHLLLIYIVTSKPKRMSLYTGVDHFIEILLDAISFLSYFESDNRAIQYSK